jgi:hypothetical protein
MYYQCILWAVLLAGPGVQTYHRPTADEKAILEKYLHAMKTIRQQYNALDCEAVLVESPVRADGTIDQGRQQRRHISFAKDGVSMVLRTKWYDAAGERFENSYRKILGTNATYTFLLSRNAATKQAPYNIIRIGSPGSEKAAFRYYMKCFLDAMHGTYYADAITLLTNPSLEIGALESFRAADGTRCLRINYRHAPLEGSNLYTSGWITVSPDEGWSTKEFYCQGADPTTWLHGRVAYRASSDRSGPLPTSIAVESNAATRTLTVADIKVGKHIGADAFSLSGYGLPESVAVQPTAWPVAVGWLATGVLSLAGWIVLKARYRVNARDAIAAP